MLLQDAVSLEIEVSAGSCFLFERSNSDRERTCLSLNLIRRLLYFSVNAPQKNAAFVLENI